MGSRAYTRTRRRANARGGVRATHLGVPNGRARTNTEANVGGKASGHAGERAGGRKAQKLPQASQLSHAYLVWIYIHTYIYIYI